MPKASKKFELPKEIRTQADLKKFDAYFREVVKKGQVRSREDKAFETLRPALIKKHIQNGQDLVLYPRIGGEIRYTAEQLRNLDELLRKTEKNYKAAQQGVPVNKLLRSCLQIDIDRAKGKVTDGSGIKNASLHNIAGNILSFMVSASPKSGFQFHKVRLRLEEWTSQMVSGTDYVTATQRAVKGRVSFDCDCGRMRYWYRFLAVIGNYAITPPTEKDFPKIRNPGLVGCACKHVIKCLHVVQSAGIIQRLANVLKKQSAAEGYADKLRYEKVRDVLADLGEAAADIQPDGKKQKPAKENKAKDSKAKPESDKSKKADKTKPSEKTKKKTDKVKPEPKKAEKPEQKVKPEPKAKPDTKQPKQPSEKVKKAFKKQEKKVIQGLQEEISKKDAEIAQLKFHQDLTKYMSKAVYRDGKTKAQAVKEFAKERKQDIQLINAMGAEVLAEF